MEEFAEGPAADGCICAISRFGSARPPRCLAASWCSLRWIWHLARQTNSGSALAVAGLMGVLPQAALAPLIGALVDRWNRRAIMPVSDTAIALATLLLALLFAAGAVQLWQIYLLLLVRSIGEGFHASALGASTVLLAPRDQLARLQGLNQALRGGMRRCWPRRWARCCWPRCCSRAFWRSTSSPPRWRSPRCCATRSRSPSAPIRPPAWRGSGARLVRDYATCCAGAGW